MKIKYVGQKLDGERAFMEVTQLEWFPGDSHEVSDAHAEKMLQYPGVFAMDDEPLTGDQINPVEAGLARAKPATFKPAKPKK